ncbi:MAG: hypothetical protein DWP98_01305 [Bacteroidetes bacterium]|nr:MAG: hypothetical protein DWP98_01305 [Bacteroidota bacterium]MBL1144416.1 hypothetical protein [Bacteroidota bacterium]MCB0803565.1 hypothetical protein [Flavobacteriales bacterium]NOG57210.1 hypothetical protein [Bacteroidota bacterium]
MKIKFPQFRRYSNELSYFKIWSEKKFDEYKITGKKLEKYEFEAKILPDRNYIHDMLYQYEPYWDLINEEEFNAFIAKHN